MEFFSQRLKKALELHEITQSELSRRTGIDKSLLSNYLSGKYKAKSNNLFLLAKALNTSEAWLMGYDVPMERNTPDTSKTDENINEFTELFGKLTPEQQNLIISQIKGILSNQ